MMQDLPYLVYKRSEQIGHQVTSQPLVMAYCGQESPKSIPLGMKLVLPLCWACREKTTFDWSHKSNLQHKLSASCSSELHPDCTVVVWKNLAVGKEQTGMYGLHPMLTSLQSALSYLWMFLCAYVWMGENARFKNGRARVETRV